MRLPPCSRAMSSFINLGKAGAPAVNMTLDRRDPSLPLHAQHPLGNMLRPYPGQDAETDREVVFANVWTGKSPKAESEDGTRDIGTAQLPASGRMSDSMSIVLAPKPQVSALSAQLAAESLRRHLALPEMRKWLVGTNGRLRPRSCSVPHGNLHFHLSPDNPQREQIELAVFVGLSLSCEVGSYRSTVMARSRHNHHHTLRKLMFSMKGTGSAYGVGQRMLPLLHADLRTGVVEQVRVVGGSLHVYTDLLSPEMRAHLLQIQRQEFLGADPGRGMSTCNIAAQAGVTDDTGEGGGHGSGDDAAGEAHEPAPAGTHARSESGVTDTDSDSEEQASRAQATAVGGGAASRTRRRSGAYEDNTGPRLRARRVILHRPSNGTGVRGRMSPDYRKEGFIPLEYDSDEYESDGSIDVGVYTHSVADCYASAMALGGHFEGSDLEDYLSSEGEWDSC